MPPRRYIYGSPGDEQVAKTTFNGAIPSLLIPPFTNTPADAAANGRRRKRLDPVQGDPSLHIYRHDTVTSSLSVLVSRKVTSAQDALEVAPPLPYTDVEGERVSCVGGNGGSRALHTVDTSKSYATIQGKHPGKSMRNRDRNWRPCKTCSDAKIKCDLLSSGICSKCAALGLDKCPPYEPPAARVFSRTVQPARTSTCQKPSEDVITTNQYEQNLGYPPANLHIMAAAYETISEWSLDSTSLEDALNTRSQRIAKSDRERSPVRPSTNYLREEYASPRAECSTVSQGSVDEVQNLIDENEKPPPTSPGSASSYEVLTTMHEKPSLSPDRSGSSDERFYDLPFERNRDPIRPSRYERITFTRAEQYLGDDTPGDRSSIVVHGPYEGHQDQHDADMLLQHRYSTSGAKSPDSYVSELSHALTPISECLERGAFAPVDIHTPSATSMTANIGHRGGTNSSNVTDAAVASWRLYHAHKSNQRHRTPSI